MKWLEIITTQCIIDIRTRKRLVNQSTHMKLKLTSSFYWDGHLCYSNNGVLINWAFCRFSFKISGNKDSLFIKQTHFWENTLEFLLSRKWNLEAQNSIWHMIDKGMKWGSIKSMGNSSKEEAWATLEDINTFFL